eukprot:5653430-Pyramimonas_sp.AAC.1
MEKKKNPLRGFGMRGKPGFYDAHKIARLLAGTCRGPRGRRHNRVPTSRASAAEWIDKFQLAGEE